VQSNVPKNLLAWFRPNARDLPWRRTRDPYAIWISEVMLQQTQVKTVIPYWNRWMARLPTIADLAQATEEQVLRLWEGLGYYSRARNAMSAARVIMAEHAGRFPSAFEAVLALPGIGRYTAGAICSIAFNQPQPVVDGNVVRVLTRLFAIRGNPKEAKTNKRIWQCAGDLVVLARKIDPESGCGDLNQSLMELGATICVPQNPLCAECPVKRSCRARGKKKIEHYPKRSPRVPTIERRFVAFVLEHQGRYLVRQRPARVVNQGLWEFPNIELTGELSLVELARKHLGIDLSLARNFATVRHTITRYRITMDVFRCEAAALENGAAGNWLSAGELEKLPFSSAHRKIARQISGKKRGRGSPAR
jgi:A/G-specific adenine glycosylase